MRLRPSFRCGFICRILGALGLAVTTGCVPVRVTGAAIVADSLLRISMLLSVSALPTWRIHR